MHLPEEIIHAAGMLPVILWRSNKPITLGDAHISARNCAITRGVIDDVVTGRLPFLDGLVIYRTCLQAWAIPYVIERNAPLSYMESIYLPVFITSPLAKDYLLLNLEKLRVSLEKFSGQRITDQSLQNSIRIYNKDRALLRRLYELRRERHGLLKAKEVLAIVQSSMLMPKEEHIKLLEELLPQLERRESSTEKKPQLILTGCLCQAPQTEFLDLIEDEGGEIVDDDMFVGSQYFASDVELQGNPMEAFANRYLKRTPTALTKSDWTFDWPAYIVDMARKNGAQGVISLLVKFCPPHMLYLPDFDKRMVKDGIPELMLEIEHEIPPLEAMRTRVAAFMEILRGG